MDRLSFEPGRLVRSIQGRDAGRYFVILSLVDEKHVLMADGLTRKLNHPKKKKIMHLRAKPILVNVDGATLPNKHLQDSDLRKALSDNGLALNDLPSADAASGNEKED